MLAVANLSQVVHALNSAASSVAPVFQSTIIAKLPGPLQTVWSDLSSPAAFTLGFTQGALDGAMSVFNQMADSIPALASTASSVTSCAIFMSCSGLASDLSSAAQAVSTADPAKIIDSAKHFVLDPFADIANRASSGDWNGAGVASGHAAVGVVQAALAVSGICEAVMADSCFLPTIADMMDLVDAADAVTGVDPDVWNFPTTDVPPTGRVIGSPDFEVPPKAWDTLNYLDQTGTAPAGTYQANPTVNNVYENYDGQLPTATGDGTPVTYNEWDVNPFTTQKARGLERLVTGSDNSAWYTGTHYNKAPLGQNWIPMR
jgi:hypothetical protein